MPADRVGPENQAQDLLRRLGSGQTMNLVPGQPIAGQHFFGIDPYSFPVQNGPLCQPEFNVKLTSINETGRPVKWGVNFDWKIIFAKDLSLDIQTDIGL